MCVRWIHTPTIEEKQSDVLLLLHSKGFFFNEKKYIYKERKKNTLRRLLGVLIYKGLCLITRLEGFFFSSQVSSS